MRVYVFLVTLHFFQFSVNEREVQKKGPLKVLGDTDMQGQMQPSEWNTMQESPSAGGAKIVSVYTCVSMCEGSMALVQGGGKGPSDLEQNSDSNQVQFPERGRKKTKQMVWILNKGFKYFVLYFIVVKPLKMRYILTHLKNIQYGIVNYINYIVNYY